MAIISFDGRANIGIRLIHEQYPDAYLNEIDGWSSTGPTKDPNKIDRMRIVMARNHGLETIIIEETSFNKFGEPKLYKDVWVGDVVIKWPIPMDLPEAIKLKESAGYKEPFQYVTVRNPLGPVRTNPFFIFSTTNRNEHVFVDIVTKEVHVVDSVHA